jgi:hypothetical protein
MIKIMHDDLLQKPETSFITPRLRNLRNEIVQRETSFLYDLDNQDLLKWSNS